MISIIAKAIERADKSYFFENYTNQAQAVVQELNKAGLVIVPIEPDEKMINAGVASIVYGRSKPSAIVKDVYSTMVKNYSSKKNI
ncbi:MAG: hypothetical protein K0R02_427 [Rickettsiaceae bacterium]|jgi:hypothetical protein|nr:hypothetical protein [Rickettsiaceae bacterium]